MRTVCFAIFFPIWGCICVAYNSYSDSSKSCAIATTKSNEFISYACVVYRRYYGGALTICGSAIRFGYKHSNCSIQTMDGFGNISSSFLLLLLDNIYWIYCISYWIALFALSNQNFVCLACRFVPPLCGCCHWQCRNLVASFYDEYVGDLTEYQIIQWSTRFVGTCSKLSQNISFE